MNLTKSQIIDLLPHREPMLLIDELRDIKKLHSATAIMNVKKDNKEFFQVSAIDFNGDLETFYVDLLSGKKIGPASRELAS